jgi:hypothetical protein
MDFQSVGANLFRRTGSPSYPKNKLSQTTREAHTTDSESFRISPPPANSLGAMRAPNEHGKVLFPGDRKRHQLPHNALRKFSKAFSAGPTTPASGDIAFM